MEIAHPVSGMAVKNLKHVLTMNTPFYESCLVVVVVVTVAVVVAEAIVCLMPVSSMDSRQLGHSLKG